MSVPSRPIIPYISLDDLNTKEFFTNTRVQKHLRRAGLLNRNGEILTQAEYDSKITDVAIGRENRRKIDDVITEVLNDMAREHWAFARDHMEEMKKNLLHEFGRIEKQYRRRTQPIIIRHTFDGKVKVEPNEPTTVNQSFGTESSTKPTTSKLPPISPAKGRRDSQSFQSPNNQRSTELDSIRQGLNEVKNTLANFAQSNTNSERNDNDDDLRRFEQLLFKLEEKQNSIQEQQRTLNRKCDEEKQRLDELYRQFKPHDDQTKSSDTDRQETEDSFQTSIVIKELKNRLLILETVHHHLPSGLPQEAIDQAIKASEKKTMDREHVIENLIHGTNDKIKELEIQYAQLLARLERLPTPITHIDVNQLIQNKMQDNLTNRDDRLDQQPTTTSQLPDKPKSKEDPFTGILTSKELQTIMPFIELLPTFDIFDENEWN